MNLARHFSEVDWYGFAGCQSWPAASDGSCKLPMIRDVNERILMVADVNGFGAFIGDVGDDQLVLVLPMARPAAELFLNAIPESIDEAGLKALGFEEV